VVRVLINARGRVEEATVQQSSGYQRLDKSALAAARKTRFIPYSVNGVAQAALADIPYNFGLRN